ncbi:MAG: hypothetical protein SF187_03165 [Deltaproteobacteria bacterium]|nr:hypothetical protein [Deltaproteobacteria bacterium]
MRLVTRPTTVSLLILISAACASGTSPPSKSDGGAYSGGSGGGAGSVASGGQGGNAGNANGGSSGGNSHTGGANAGGMGTGGSNAGGAGSGSGCTGQGVLFCDNFDKAAANSEPAAPFWVPQPAWQNDRNKIVSTQSHSPPHSVTVTAASYGSHLIAAMGFPPVDNSFFVRVFMRLEKSTKDMGGHVDFIEGAESETDAGEELRLGASHGIVDVNLIPGNKGSGGGEKTQFSNGDVDIPRDTGGVVLEAGRWYCIEAHFDGKNHQFHLWIDDKEQATMNVSDWKQGRTGWSPAYKFLKIGGQNFSGQMGRAWYDDVAVGSKRIGCS